MDDILKKLNERKSHSKPTKAKWKVEKEAKTKEEQTINQLERHKMLGYCPDCHKFISNNDLIADGCYKCWGCSSENPVGELLAEKPIAVDIDQKYMKPKKQSKKNYLLSLELDETALSEYDEHHLEVITPHIHNEIENITTDY
jgi:hypothetical protein